MNSLFRGRYLAVAGLACLLVFVAGALLAPWIAPYDPQRQVIAERLQGPSPRHWLGTDQFGRDIFSRVLYGGQVSLGIALLSVLLGLVVGGLLGLGAGYFRRLDGPVMRTMDVLLSFPAVLLAIMVVTILRPGVLTVIIAVGIRSIPAFARMVRGAVLVVRGLPYAEAAAAIGASHLRTITRTILPNSLPPVLVFSTLQIANNILLAAILSYLGLGIQPPGAEWGLMVSQGRGWLRDAPHVAMMPGLAIFAVVLAVNMVGDGLRDRLDVKLKESA
jgi:peptide/nickel transport system permease protein